MLLLIILLLLWIYESTNSSEDACSGGALSVLESKNSQVPKWEISLVGTFPLVEKRI